MFFSVIILIAFCTTISMACIAAWSDFRSMRIANSISYIIGLSYIVALIADNLFIADSSILGAWWSGLLAATIVFIVTFGMFAIGMIGGGDSKLATALSLWIGVKGLIALMFYMSLAGGILAIIAITCRNKQFLEPLASKMGDKSWASMLYNNKNALPYGIAILVGSMGAFWYIGLFQNMYSLSTCTFLINCAE